VNARGKFLMARAALRRMLEQPPDAASGLRGTLLFMASVQATAPDSLHFDTHGYAASKAAVVGLSQAVAAYYARDGIRSNAIAPAVTRTPLTQRAQASPELMAYLEQRQPLSRGILEADDVARASLFLLSGESRHITGQTLEVDGGWSSAR
jgi:NAD(P)-dependent dehydrogenase (short-subunit alcohol dehydrogenase family)